MLKHSKDEKAKKGLLGKFFFSFNNWFRKTTNSYSRGVALWIRRWPYIVVLLAVIFVGLFFLFKAKPTGFIPQEDEGRLYLTYEMPEGASTNRSIDMLTTIQKKLSAIPEINEAGGLAGYNIISSSNKSNVGTMFIHLKPWDERKGSEHSQTAVMQKIYQKTADIKGAKILVIAPPAVPGLGRTSGFTFELQQTTSTDDIQQFSKVAQNFLGQLNKMPQIGGAYTFFTANTPSYQVDVNREKAKQLGVSVADVYNTMSTLLGSAYINDFNLYGRNFRVVSQADSVYRSSLSEIGKYYVRNNQGNMIPLSSLITSKLIDSATAISHYNIYRSIEINGTPAPGYSSGQAIEALKEAAAKYLPTGYAYEFSGMSSEEIKSGSKTGMIFAISIIFVFLFLAALYESWSVPFSVLLAVPIGALGSIIALTCFPNLTDNIYAQIGLITLIGLAAKNAILIVEFAKERVDAGMDLMKATISAVKLRLRPILMTSFAFILGVLPVAFASGAAAESRKTIGWTVFGGMLAATSLAIFVVPVLYVVITKAAYGKKKLAELKAGYKPEEHEEFEEDID
jgi:HAE1 family hydrophobic/amphiphilic exporter-1